MGLHKVGHNLSNLAAVWLEWEIEEMSEIATHVWLWLYSEWRVEALEGFEQRNDIIQIVFLKDPLWLYQD